MSLPSTPHLEAAILSLNILPQRRSEVSVAIERFQNTASIAPIWDKPSFQAAGPKKALKEITKIRDLAGELSDALGSASQTAIRMIDNQPLPDDFWELFNDCSQMETLNALAVLHARAEAAAELLPTLDLPDKRGRNYLHGPRGVASCAAHWFERLTDGDELQVAPHEDGTPRFVHELERYNQLEFGNALLEIYREKLDRSEEGQGN